MQIEAEMVTRLQRGDREARQTFWQETFGPVLSVCSRVLGGGPVAVDVTTDLLNDFMFRYVENLARPQGAWSYLKLMAVRRSVRERQRMINREQFDEGKGKAIHAPQDSADDVLLLPKLDDCLSLLTPKAQSAVRLKYRQGFSNEKIGETVGGSKQYIGRLMKQSLAALKECLERKAVTNG